MRTSNARSVILGRCVFIQIPPSCKYLETQGFDISYVDVDKNGILKVDELKKAIISKTILITIMHANNEVGSIQPIKEIGEIAKQHNIVFHTDASQSVGKIETNVNDLNVDLLTIAGHKIYAPKGIGALYIKKGIKLNKLLFGANHESNKRPGTENVVQIVGLGKAVEIAHQEFDENTSNMKAMRDYLLEKINTLNFDARSKHVVLKIIRVPIIRIITYIDFIISNSTIFNRSYWFH